MNRYCYVCEKDLEGNEEIISVRDVVRIDLPGDHNEHAKYEYENYRNGNGVRNFCSDHVDHEMAQSYERDSYTRKEAKTL